MDAHDRRFRLSAPVAPTHCAFGCGDMTRTWLFGVALACGLSGCRAATERYDVVVYGGTSSGVVAAVKVARLGRPVVLVEPGRHVGGLSSGGLGATDIGNKQAIGGMAREFYRRVGRAYGQDEAWMFEPHVAERVFTDMLHEAGVPVVFGERLELGHGLKKDGTRLTAIVMESGRTFRGRVFIDATYEGDLMATAGASYYVGREGNAMYGETLNGVQVAHAVHHQFIKPVDPYVVPSDLGSGLLPGIDRTGPGAEGAADQRVQAYCFRLCATDVPENRRPWPRPADYDPLQYELLLRNFEAGDEQVPWHAVMMPNRKTDANNNYAVSTDYIGMNYAYPDGDYAVRDRIVRARVLPERADVDAGEQSTGAGENPGVLPHLGPGAGRVRRQRQLAAPALRARGAPHGRRLRDDPARLRGPAKWPRTPWGWQLTPWTRTTCSAT